MAKLRKWSNVLAMKNRYGAGGTASGFSGGGGKNSRPSSGVDSLGYGYGSTKDAIRGRKTPAPAPPRRRR